MVRECGVMVVRAETGGIMAEVAFRVRHSPNAGRDGSKSAARHRKVLVLVLAADAGETCDAGLRGGRQEWHGGRVEVTAERQASG